ncbi:MAG: 50S ribosomal protein L9 [Bacteroidales bacterium]|jgi:large subunit ribosomal protein L9|nr:50S ribosomal protein L9 [Bacteroidales bacterium]
MDVILKEDVLNLGFENDIVPVKNGYARNYLFPKRLAIPATESNRKILAETIKQRTRKLERLKTDAEAIANRLNNITVRIKVKSSEEGTVYGSVTNIHIAEALKEQFDIEIDRRKINIGSRNIKELGQYKVTVPLQKEVTAEFVVDVIAE